MTVFTAVAAVFTAVASALAAVTSIFHALATENTDETAVTNTAATSVKFSSHRSKISFRVRFGTEAIRTIYSLCRRFKSNSGDTARPSSTIHHSTVYLLQFGMKINQGKSHALSILGVGKKRSR